MLLFLLLKTSSALFFETRLADQKEVCSITDNPSSLHSTKFWIYNKIYAPIFNKWIAPTDQSLVNWINLCLDNDSFPLRTRNHDTIPLNFAVFLDFYWYSACYCVCDLNFFLPLHDEPPVLQKNKTWHFKNWFQTVIHLSIIILSYEKVIPMVWFTIMSVFIFCVTGALVYESWNVEYYMYNANCKLAKMVDVINYGTSDG